MTRRDWGGFARFLKSVNATLESCVAVAAELEDENTCARESGLDVRRFHAGRFLKKCGWHVRQDFWLRYPTNEARCEKLAELSADILDDKDVPLWRWLLRVCY
jgi:hypothetical protein